MPQVDNVDVLDIYIEYCLSKVYIVNVVDMQIELLPKVDIVDVVDILLELLHIR